MGSGAERVPPALRKLLNFDIQLTKNFVDGVGKKIPQVNTPAFVNYMKGLEISCHGVPWFACVLISIYLFRSDASREIEMNLLFALVYDVMVISFVKAVTRRNRPIGNRSEDMFMTKGPDKFSFPSGHASRAVLIALFFTQWAIPEMSIVFQMALLIWAGAVCISRVLLRRHHILDVTAGIGLGYLEFLLTGFLWIGPSASKALGDWIATSSEDD